MDVPCVSVLTPVYNGEKYLAECIESVLGQDYPWSQYTIVNNCSTDGTLEIAQSYAKRDRRIQVKTNAVFVGACDNHNIAFRFVPPHAKYCKVLSADDWIEPGCVGKMVRFAEAHPTVGIVGSYQRSGDKVRWQGLPVTVGVVAGRDAGRLGLLEGVFVFGTPTSCLYRADLLRMRPSFFPHNRSYADTSACYEAFQHCDFGFLHEVLSAERVHSGQWTAEMDAVDAGNVGYLDVVLQYGPLYLTAAEFAARKKQVFDTYYRALGGCLLKLKGRHYWDFHQSRLREMGLGLDWGKVARAAIREALTEARNPVTATRKVVAVLKGRQFLSRNAMENTGR
jgi:glycosyltransferase involved in cell wall biosynthesis